MDGKEPQLKIQYTPSGDGAAAVCCFGPAPVVRLPETVGGLPLRAVCPYAFSSEGAAAERLPAGTGILTAETEGAPAPGGRLLFLGGPYLREIELPSGIRSIGEYAFYNCTGLRRTEMPGGIVRVGNGAFMNCGALSDIGFSASPAERTCLPELLAELPGEIRVSFRRGRGASVFLFPEYYEESVENTPARIFEHKIVGVGYRYRQCFDGATLKPDEYDGQFPVCLAQMEPETALRIALNRLSSPAGMRRSAREEYLGYLREHAAAAALLMVERDDPDGISFLAGLGALSRESIGAAVEEAARKGRAECLGVLLNERHRLFPESGRKFEL